VQIVCCDSSVCIDPVDVRVFIRFWWALCHFFSLPSPTEMVPSDFSSSDSSIQEISEGKAACYPEAHAPVPASLIYAVPCVSTE